MDDSVTLGSEQRQRRRRWLWTLGGCFGLIVVLCIVIVVGGRIYLAKHGAKTTHTWAQAAVNAKMTVYKPTYLPPGSGEPNILTLNVGNGVKSLTAQYAGGKLAISEVNRVQKPNDGRATTVRGADQAWFTSQRGRHELVIIRDGTTIQLLGPSDSDLLKVGESLQPVRG